MASFYRSTVEQFLTESVERVLARLEVAYANRGYTSQYSDQILAWQRDIHLLRQSLGECVARSESSRSWGLLLEFSIPRKELRLDTVLLIQGSIVVLEAKTGQAASQAKRQIEEYSLLLHCFHKDSNERRIVPILIGDFVRDDRQGWQLRRLQHGAQSKWRGIKSAAKRIYRRNAYRVLLTRARKG
jgi:hypothetical protein